MDDYESKKFIAKSENITVGELLDIWAEEELKTGTLSNWDSPEITSVLLPTSRSIQFQRES